jgi:hypothetical protein
MSATRTARPSSSPAASATCSAHLPERLHGDLTEAKGRPLDGALALARGLP